MASPWATPEDLRLHLRLESIDTEQAAAAIAAAERVIRGELEQTIDAVAGDTETLVGTGRRVMMLPQVPVTAITSVTEDGEALTEGTDYRWNRHGILTRLGDPPRPGCRAGWQLDTDIVVVYDHGLQDTPEAVTQVCVQVAGRAWVNPRGFAAESLGDHSVTHDKARTGQALTDYELRMLGRYGLGPQSR